MSKIRIKLRTKINTEVNDPDQLASRELIAGNLEKSLFYKDMSSDDIYRFSPIDDDGDIDVYRTWSSQKISDYLDDNFSSINHTHNYYDLTGIPDRSILFTAAGIGLPTSSPCSSPTVAGGTTPYWYTQFEQNEVGFFNFAIPNDFNNTVTRITFFYSDYTGSSNWTITGTSYVDGNSLTSPVTTDTLTITVPGVSSGNIGIYQYDYTSGSSILGSPSDLAKMINIKLTLTSAQPVKFHGMRLDYN